jgi:hypothetical protein
MTVFFLWRLEERYEALAQSQGYGAHQVVVQMHRLRSCTLAKSARVQDDIFFAGELVDFEERRWDKASATLEKRTTLGREATPSLMEVFSRFHFAEE